MGDIKSRRDKTRRFLTKAGFDPDVAANLAEHAGEADPAFRYRNKAGKEPLTETELVLDEAFDAIARVRASLDRDRAPLSVARQYGFSVPEVTDELGVTTKEMYNILKERGGKRRVLNAVKSLIRKELGIDLDRPTSPPAELPPGVQDIVALAERMRPALELIDKAKAQGRPI